jgi:hypothetical protein
MICLRKRRRVFNHKEHSAAEPQLKSKQTLHHEGHEEHEVRNSKVLISESFVSFVHFVVNKINRINTHGTRP